MAARSMASTPGYLAGRTSQSGGQPPPANSAASSDMQEFVVLLGACLT